MPTKTFNKAVIVYNALVAKGTEATEGHVFEGSLRAIIIETEVGLDYYQPVRNLLANMECIRYLRTSHGRNPSLLHLIRPPTVELYNEYRATNKGGAGKRGNDEVMLGRINDIARRMNDLEAEMRSIIGIVKAAFKPNEVEDGS